MMKEYLHIYSAIKPIDVRLIGRKLKVENSVFLLTECNFDVNNIRKPKINNNLHRL